MKLQRMVASAALVLSAAAPCAAQGTFGLGARMSMIRGDVQVNPAATAQRFTGGQIRARISPKTSLEVSLDRRTEDSLDLTQRVRDYPLQGSLLLFPVHSTFAPYVLGGVGWYTHVVDTMNTGKVTESTSTRKMGYHAGLGAEARMGRHAGVHADYRYTMVHFGDGTGSASLAGGKAVTGSSAGTTGLASRFLPSYDGSMWTGGVTFYF
ncbi:MAG TPA: outer membrane beta-barrel protein [Vicinamibacterales bacterium]